MFFEISFDPHVFKVHIPPLAKFRPETPYGVKRSHAKDFQNRNCGFPTIKADFLSLQKLLATIFFQKKSV